MAGADRAFVLLADPVRLPELVSTMRLEDSIAVEGEADLDADVDDRDGAPEAGFLADMATRHIEWGRPERDYGGSIDVAENTASTANVTLRLHTRDDADVAEVTRIVDATVATIRRVLSAS